MLTGKYEFLAQDRVVFGRPADEAVAEQIELYRAQKVFLVSSQTLSRKTDVVDTLRRALGPRFVDLFDETVQHVPRESVIACAEAVRRAAPDMIVTIGGGTPIDTVKIALVCLAENVRTIDALGEYRVQVRADGMRHVPAVGRPPLRQIVVPTTLSAAEFSNLGGCTDLARKVKDLYTGREIGAQVAILDPRLTVHTPDWLWLSTGIRAVDHAVETICSRGPQPFTDATCLHALAMLNRSLRRNKEQPDDLDARLESQLGAWLASAGLGRVEWGASHGIGHQLGAVADVPHGHTSCVLLPSVLRYNAPVNGERQRQIATAMGSEGGDAADSIGALIAALGLPRTLREVGVKKEHYDLIANGAMQNMMVRSNPRPITTPDQVKEILDLAW